MLAATPRLLRASRPCPVLRLAALLLLALPAAAQAPLLTLAPTDETLEGNFGFSVAGAGDVDGDGAPDLVVGAPGENVGTTSDAGHAYVYRGADGGLLYQLPSPDPQGFGRFGTSVAMTGDVDGDGLSDILVGAPSEDVGGASSAGRAHVFSGFTGAFLYTLASPNVQDGGNFGAAVAGVGDTDGDGVADLLVGAFAESPESAGRAHLFSGAGGTLLCTLVSPDEEAGGSFGWSVASAGDLDGDGRGDLLVGAISERNSRGQAHAFSGATGELLRTRFSPNAELGGDFGVSVAGVGDTNGDGVPDVLVGAEGEDVDGIFEAGRAYLYSGATGALLRTLLSPTPFEVGSFGGSVAGAGDQDGDGRADVIVGANSEEGAGLESAGQAHVFSGDDGALLYTLTSPTATRFGVFGVAVAFAGDVNSDGAPDVIVGASRDTPAGSPVGAGRAHVFGGAGQTAAVTVDIEPVNPPIIIPAGGGSFEFTLTLSNTTGVPQTVEVSTAVEGPVSRDPVLGPRIVTLPAGAMVTRTLTQQVPAAAPAGAYTYSAKAELPSGAPLDSDAFVFVKESAAREGAPPALAVAGAGSYWAVSGWDENTAASALSGGFALGEVSPNPFAFAAHVAVEVEEAQAVRVEVFDGLGRRVAVLHDGALEAGRHTLVFDGSALPAGVYVVRATGETFAQTRRAALRR